MSVLIKFANCYLIQRFSVRLHSISSQHTNLIEFDYKPKFSDEEQEKILNTLNSSDKDVLLSLNVSKAKIKSMQNYTNKKGPFKSLNEVLEADGLSVKLLEKLCEQIISNTSNKSTKINSNTTNKKVRQLLVPSLTPESILDISQAVGIHLAPTGISWAKLSTSNYQLQSWGYNNFGSLPKKMLPFDTFKVATEAIEKIPSGDIYVFEGTPSMSPQGQNQPATVTSYTQQLELSSMLLALINTSHKHNPLFEVNDSFDQENFNKVHYLKPKIPARLFKTLVGNEKVSTISTISQLISNSEHNLLCNEINLDEKLKSEYLSQSSANKELLGHALMLILAFTEICIHKNVASLNAITPNRK